MRIFRGKMSWLLGELHDFVGVLLPHRTRSFAQIIKIPGGRNVPTVEQAHMKHSDECLSGELAMAGDSAWELHAWNGLLGRELKLVHQRIVNFDGDVERVVATVTRLWKDIHQPDGHHVTWWTERGAFVWHVLFATRFALRFIIVNEKENSNDLIANLDGNLEQIVAGCCIEGFMEYEAFRQYETGSFRDAPVRCKNLYENERLVHVERYHGVFLQRLI